MMNDIWGSCFTSLLATHSENSRISLEWNTDQHIPLAIKTLGGESPQHSCPCTDKFWVSLSQGARRVNGIFLASLRDIRPLPLLSGPEEKKEKRSLFCFSFARTDWSMKREKSIEIALCWLFLIVCGNNQVWCLEIFHQQGQLRKSDEAEKRRVKIPPSDSLTGVWLKGQKAWLYWDLKAYELT